MRKQHVTGSVGFPGYIKPTLLLVFLSFAGLQSATSQPAFTWVGGSGSGGEDMANTVGNYGSIGIPSVENSPGARQSAATWTDPSGNYWLYGGYCNTEFRTGLLSDMWKFSPVTKEWTWVSGSRDLNHPTTFTAVGSFDPMNTPGARLDASAWVSADGDLWLFGGKSTRAHDNQGIEAGLWKYDTDLNEWALIREEEPDGVGVYGIKGTADALNAPGARLGAASWVDNGGNFWLMGGYGKTVDPRLNEPALGEMNDLWRYNLVNGEWTWMKGSNQRYSAGTYGTKGTANADNTPPALNYATTWVDDEGNLWLLGGNFSGIIFYFNAMWKYSVVNNTWTWVSGDTISGQPGTYGAKNVFSAANTPGGRSTGTAWTDNDGILWMFSGFGVGSTAGQTGALNDLWKFDPAIAQWAWAGGSGDRWVAGVYGQSGILAPSNLPGGRRYSASWTDLSGNLWMYGGFGFNAHSEVMLNDFWKYDKASGNWSWLSGNDYPARYGRYGIPLVPAPSNRPGTRSNSAIWCDANDNLWLFGGKGYGGVGETGPLNDMWKYVPSTGTWMYAKGEFFPNHQGVYGIQGQIDNSNTPSAREGSAYWADSSDKFWLFGGNGVKGLSNDLWYFNPLLNAWEWVKGDEQGGMIGRYGSIGTHSATHNPGSRTDAVCWTDNDGDLWLFGGYGNSGQPDSVGMLNDLWKFDLTTKLWTWINGSNEINAPGSYGIQRVSSPGNKPSARSKAVAWKDDAGDFWMFGGNTTSGMLNDVWKYQVAIGEWVWMHGESLTGSPAAYGIKDVASPLNTPGARSSAAGWKDDAGTFWLLGGKSGDNRLNDLWKYSATENQWTWVEGRNIPNQTGIYGTQGLRLAGGIPGAREDSAVTRDNRGRFWLFGGYGLDQRPTISRLQGDLWLLEIDPHTAATSWELYE